MNSNLLDEYCRLEFGHTDWEMDFRDGSLIVIFYDKPRAERTLEDNDENLDIDLDGGLSAINE